MSLFLAILVVCALAAGGVFMAGVAVGRVERRSENAFRRAIYEHSDAGEDDT